MLERIYAWIHSSRWAANLQWGLFEIDGKGGEDMGVPALEARGFRLASANLLGVPVGPNQPGRWDERPR